MNRRRTLLLTGLFLTAGPAVVARVGAAPPRPALKGYDVVAYYTENRARKGSPSITHDFDGLRYQFATTQNRDLFVADPIRYLPEFGGNCAASMAKGARFEADPEQWIVVEGRLYVFGNAAGREAFQRDVVASAKAAAQNWSSRPGTR